MQFCLQRCENLILCRKINSQDSLECKQWLSFEIMPECPPKKRKEKKKKTTMFCALLITDTSFVIFKACAQLSKRACLSSVITDFKSQSLGLGVVLGALQPSVYMYTVSVSLSIQIL